VLATCNGCKARCQDNIQRTPRHELPGGFLFGAFIEVLSAVALVTAQSQSLDTHDSYNAAASFLFILLVAGLPFSLASNCILRPSPRRILFDSCSAHMESRIVQRWKGEVMAKARIKRLALLMGLLFALWMTAAANHIQFM
jgi:hypothetical protein